MPQPRIETVKTFTVGIDDRMDKTLELLKVQFHKTSKAEVFRMGVAVLKIASEALESGQMLAIADEKGKVVREIVLS